VRQGDPHEHWRRFPRHATPNPSGRPAPRLAYTPSLGLERFLDRPKRGVAGLKLARRWLVLAGRGSGRPCHLDGLAAPLLAALLGLPRVPFAKTLSRSLPRLAAKDVRAAVEAAYQAELPHRAGRVGAAVAAHPVPYWGRGQTRRFQKGDRIPGSGGESGRAASGHRVRSTR